MDLIVYFSQYGHTKKIAHEMNKTLNADSAEIKAQKPVTGSRAAVMLKGAFLAVFRIKMKIVDDPDIRKYNRIVIGSPIWAGTVTPYIRTFMVKNDFTGKKIAFFASCEGSAGSSYEHIKKLIGDDVEYISYEELKTGEKDIGSTLLRAREWAENLLTM